MHLLNLPLDCFRYLLAFIARDFDYDERVDEFVQLRKINRLMNVEVLRTLATPSFFYRNISRCTLNTVYFYGRGTGSVPWPHERRPLPSSYPDFVASFLALRPHMHTETPWNAHLSSLLNHVVDALSLDHKSILKESVRTDILRRLCRHILEMKEWRLSPTGRVGVLLYPDAKLKFMEQSDSLAFNIFLAEILLGQRSSLEGLERLYPNCDQKVSESGILAASLKRKSIVFGSLFDVCVKVGQVELVTKILDAMGDDVDVAELYPLGIASHSLNLRALRLVWSRYEPFFRTSRGENYHHAALRYAIDTGDTEAALFLIRELTWDASNLEYLGGYISQAASHNNFVFVQAILADFKHDTSTLNWLRRDVGRNGLPHVAFFGHVRMLDYLLEQGFETLPGEYLLHAAIGSGSIPMLRFVMNHTPGGLGISHSDWNSLLMVAVSYARKRHFALIEALFTDPTLLPRLGLSTKVLFSRNQSSIQLFRYACGYGNHFLVRKMAEAGLDLDHLPGFDDTPPVLLARMAYEPSIAKLLVELGAKPIDPMSTKFRSEFEKGEYPKVWPRKYYHYFYWRHTRDPLSPILHIHHEEILRF